MRHSQNETKSSSPKKSWKSVILPHGDLWSTYAHIEKTIGTMKTAVVLILLFTVCMIYGTFMESYHGADYAGRLVYKSPLFIGVQLGMFFSIFIAALLRLPPKKRLFGFYTIHTGLITIAAGSFVTYYAGIDGNITLRPMTPTRTLNLTQDVLTMRFGKAREVSYELPNSPREKKLGAKFESIELLTYLPFADDRLEWKTASPDYLAGNPTAHHSSRYLLANSFINQEVTLSLHPKASEFEATQNMGPLSVHYLPSGLYQCFDKANTSKIILWNQLDNSCFTPETQGIVIKTTPDSKHRFFAVKHEGKTLAFIPDQTPWALDEKLAPIPDATIRALSLKMFETGPHLFLFGEGAAFRQGEVWKTVSLKEKTPIELPWMGFKIKLLEHHLTEYPQLIPYGVTPIQDGGNLIKGAKKAVKIKVNDQEFWVKSEMPLDIPIGQEQVRFSLGPKVEQLPFELNLDRFKMDKDPGTNRPASFESFVDLFTPEGSTTHHIFMNNPLKYRGLTFYQASYFPLEGDENGQTFGSVLSVNMDPGRPIKYLGSLLLVFGSIWHYRLNRKKTPKKNSTPAMSVPH